MAVIPLLSSIISLLFALAVLDQFFARRRPYQLVWAVGLFMFSVSTGTEFWKEMWGLNLLVYRLWYLIGAVFVAAYLGMGSLYLLMPPRNAHIVMAVLLTASVFAAIVVFTTPVDLSTVDTLSGQAMPGSIRVITPFFNTFGTVALVGGAAYSAWVYWRSHILPHRVVSNILIAVGAIMPASGGLFIRFGAPTGIFYVLELVGIIIMLGGFMRNREIFGLYRVPLAHGFHRVTTEG